MSGPLPAGTYVVDPSGYEPGWDAQLHVDLLYRRAGMADVTLASGDGMDRRDDAGVHELKLALPVAALAASCGDELVVRTIYVAGSSDFIEFAVDLTLP